MNTEFEAVRYVPDWWSRWMALGSLIIACAALGWAYLQQRSIPDVPARDAIMAMHHRNIVEGNNLEAAERERRSKEHSKWLSEMRQQADEVLEDNRRLAEQLSELEITLTSIQTQSAKTATDQDLAGAVDGGIPPANPQPPAKTDRAAVAADLNHSDSETGDEIKADESVGPDEDEVVASDDPAPRLRVVHQVLRPEEGNVDAIAAATITIGNDSGKDAQVRSVAFEPAEVIELPKDVASISVGELSVDLWLVRYNKSHNQAAIRGKHGRYAQTLDTTMFVPGDSEADLRVVIEDDEHAGYGFRGKLTLEYDADQPLEIDGAHVYFVPKEKTG